MTGTKPTESTIEEVQRNIRRYQQYDQEEDAHSNEQRIINITGRRNLITKDPNKNKDPKRIKMTSHESPKQRKQGKTTRTMATRKCRWTQDFTGKNILMNT
jgi:hypothetical protein